MEFEQLEKVFQSVEKSLESPIGARTIRRSVWVDHLENSSFSDRDKKVIEKEDSSDNDDSLNKVCTLCEMCHCSPEFISFIEGIYICKGYLVNDHDEEPYRRYEGRKKVKLLDRRKIQNHLPGRYYDALSEVRHREFYSCAAIQRKNQTNHFSPRLSEKWLFI